MKRAISYTLACLYVVATIAAFLAGIWLSDERWGLTGMVLLLAAVPVIPTLFIFGES